MDSHGPFGNSRLINVGAEQQIQIGNPVISEHGVVGRVVGVAHGASRVLLLTDIRQPNAGAGGAHQRSGDLDRGRRGPIPSWPICGATIPCKPATAS